MILSNAVTQIPDLSLLEGEIRGYCGDKSQEIYLRAAGLLQKQIYCGGRGAETITACLASFRDRPGTLFVSAILERPLKFGNITVIGFSAALFEQLTDILDALSEATTLRRLCAIF